MSQQPTQPTPNLPIEDFDEEEEDFLPTTRTSRVNGRSISRILAGAVVLVLVFSGGAYAQRTWGDPASTSNGTPNFAQGASRAGAQGLGAGRTGASTGAAPTTSGQGNTRTGGNATVGTIKVVDGDSFYVTTTSGEVIKVNTNSSSTITKTSTAAVKDLQPGESVVIQGTTNDDGTVTARSVSNGSGGGFGAFPAG